MPIPTSPQHRVPEGRTAGQADAIGAALRDKFGENLRITDIAVALADRPDIWVDRMAAAQSLDDLDLT